MTTRGDHAYLSGIVDSKFWIRGEKEKLGIGFQTPSFDVAAYVADKVGQAVVEHPGVAFDRRPCSIHCKHAHQHVVTSMSYRVTLTTLRAAIVIHNVQNYLIRRRDFTVRLKGFDHWLRWTDHTNLTLVKYAGITDTMGQLGWEVPVAWTDVTDKVAVS